MANPGTITGITSNVYIDSKIEWSYTQDLNGNTSTITAKLYYKRNDTGQTTYGMGDFSITIDGQRTVRSESMNITNSKWEFAMSATKTVNHSGDGTKTIIISASGSISGTSLKSTSCSGSITLDTIPRASTITSASNVTLGKACAVKWTPKSTSFRYRLEFTLGDWSDTTGVIYPNTTSAYTYTGYPLPLKVANHLPNATTGTMTVTLYTYSNSGATTQVGSASSKTFTVTVPDNASTKPSVTMKLSAVSSLDEPFSSLYIQGKSKVKATFSGSGEYSAKISSYSMSALGETYGSPYESKYISIPGSVTVTGTAIDSRGYKNTDTKTITSIPYSKPQLLAVSGENEVVAARCDKDGKLTDSGTYLKIKAKRSYSKVMVDGVQKNFCQIRYRYKAEGGSYSSWETILASKPLSSDEVITGALLSGELLATSTYLVQVQAIDDIGDSSTTTITIPTDKVYMHRAGSMNSLGIGKYAEDENTIDIAEDITTKFRGKVEIGSSAITDFVTEIGVWNIDDNDSEKGYWRYRKWKSGAVDMNGLIKVAPVAEGTLGTAGVYYSEVIYIDLPFEVVNFQFTGSSTSYHCFVGNCNSVDGNYKQIRLRLYRFTDFSSLADYDVYVRIVASGKCR